MSNEMQGINKIELKFKDKTHHESEQRLCLNRKSPSNNEKISHYKITFTFKIIRCAIKPQTLSFIPQYQPRTKYNP